MAKRYVEKLNVRRAGRQAKLATIAHENAGFDEFVANHNRRVNAVTDAPRLYRVGHDRRESA